MSIITRTVWILSIVSLLADIASEMLYPIVPVYLKHIGFSVLWIGLLEGVANCTAGISKGYFGKLSDEKASRLPFIKWGYLLSAIAKPMMAFFTNTAWIFFARTTDRLGKGIRTAPRDALLSQEGTHETRARIFGFHRSLDTVGATLGPLIALVFLYFYPAQYKTIFLLAFIPGIASVLMLFLIREKKEPASPNGSGNFFAFLGYWKQAAPSYRKLVAGLLLVALFNSSDVFLLLKTKEITGSDSLTITAYVFYNLVFALLAYPLGMLADKLGFKKIFLPGLLLFIITYMGFAFVTGTTGIFILFLLYAIYAAATEGLAIAWITNLSRKDQRATAIGFYTSCQSIAALLASSMAGAIWSASGSAATFIVTAAAGLLSLIYFSVIPVKRFEADHA